MHSVLAKLPTVTGPMGAAIVCTIFVPRGKADLVTAEFDEIVTMLMLPVGAVTADLADHAAPVGVLP